MEWYINVLREYFNFKGRTHRKEFWIFLLFHVVISITLRLIEQNTGFHLDSSKNGALTLTYSILTTIPMLSVIVRRLHDTNRSGWWVFLTVIPLLGALCLLFLLAKKGFIGVNEYGKDPLPQINYKP